MFRSSIRRGPLFSSGDPVRFLGLLCLVALCVMSVSAQEEPEAAEDPAWTGSLSFRAQSRLAQYGLEAAPEGVTFVAGGGISHRSGFSFDLSTAWQPSPWIMQRFTASAEYEWTLSEVWVLGASIERSWYPTGSVNPLATSPLSISISGGYDGEVWSLGAGFDRYLGGEGASYISVDASVFVAMEGFNLLPLATASFGTQTVASAILQRGKGKTQVGSSSVSTITGLSSADVFLVIQVPLGSGWSCSAMPGVSYTPSDLASTTTRFTWSLGIRKAL